MNISVIIPVYNEENRLAKTLLSVTDFLGRQTYDSEILVVNDGSTDGTVSLIESFSKKYQKIKLVDNKKNSGKGHAVRSGMLVAKGEYRLFMDADGSTPIEEVSKLLPLFSLGYDVVIGSRRVEGAIIKTEQSSVRLFLGWIFRLLTNLILPLGVIDSQNGFKMFRAKAAEDIFSRQTISGWAFDVEILALAKRLSYKVKEVPIVWTDDVRSKVTFGGMVKMLFEILKIRIRIANQHANDRQ